VAEAGSVITPVSQSVGANVDVRIDSDTAYSYSELKSYFSVISKYCENDMVLGLLIVSVGRCSDTNSLLLDVPFTPDSTFQKVPEREATEVGTVVCAIS
jgi:hypothetical protein